MSLTEKAIEKIEDMALEAAESFIGKDEKEYTFKKVYRVYDDPRPKSLKVFSLQGILDFVENNVDKYKNEDLMLHIVDHQRVDLVTDIHGETNERHTILSAVLDGESFRFERFIDQEQFIINVRSLFQMTDDTALILVHTSKIETETAIKTDDDGVSQVIQVKKGLSGALVEKADLKSIVKLKPYRTFREIEQPEGEFLFRMKNDDGVTCALFEADGGSWKNEARKLIAEFFMDSGVAIIA